jgi:hypothetical protein
MSNTSQDLHLFYGISKIKKITLGKRILIYFLNFAFFLIIYFSIFYTAGTSIVTSISQEAITGLNERFAVVCDELDYPCGAGSDFGIYELKEEQFISNLQETNPELSEQECYDLFFAAEDEVLTELADDSLYVQYYSEFHRNYLFVDAACMLVPSLVLTFFIPLYDKENRTLGMKIFKTSLTDAKDSRLSAKYKHIPRFVILFIELFVTKIVFNYYSFIMLPLMELVIMISTPKRQTIYDALSFTRVINTDSVDRSDRAEEYYIPSE